jgi:hypothetical protein
MGKLGRSYFVELREQIFRRSGKRAIVTLPVAGATFTTAARL